MSPRAKCVWVVLLLMVLAAIVSGVLGPLKTGG